MRLAADGRSSSSQRHGVVHRMVDLILRVRYRLEVDLLSLAAAVFVLSQASLAQPTDTMIKQTAHLNAFGGYILPSTHAIGSEDISAAVRVQYGEHGYTVRLITPISARWPEARDAPNLASQLAALPQALRDRSPHARRSTRLIPIRPKALRPCLI